MIEGSRKHGPFDTRWQRNSPHRAAGAAAADVPDGLDWAAFSARSNHGRRRHDLDVIRAYHGYRNDEQGGEKRRLGEERAESDAENEGMPPKPEPSSERVLIRS
jgi:hypothetical protein